MMTDNVQRARWLATVQSIFLTVKGKLANPDLHPGCRNRANPFSRTSCTPAHCRRTVEHYAKASSS